MSEHSELLKHYLDFDRLPASFPTHRHAPEFWEALGRAVATFGYLEEVLGKAIFSFTGTRRIPDDEVEEEFAKWIPKLEKAISDPLGPLIRSYGDAVRANKLASVPYLDDLLEKLRNASVVRNVLCHGSWRSPDSEGRSIPLFVTPGLKVFQTAVDRAYLDQVQRHTTELACAVVNSVTQTGWQFPGSNGPGAAIFRRQDAEASPGD